MNSMHRLTWRDDVSIAIAVILLVACTSLLHTTGGIGAIATAVVVTIAFNWWITRNRPHSAKGSVWTLAVGVLAVTFLWNTVSLATSVFPTEGEPISQKIATWGRDHGMDSLVNYMETVAYSDPPSKQPAKSLSLDPSMTAASTTSTTSAPVNSALDTTTTTDPGPKAPAPLTPPISPALPGEGAWIPVAKAGGYDSVWVTSVRPLPKWGGVVASIALIDQTFTRAGLFNGSDEPGGRWQRGSRVPDDLQPMLLAAFNGGFRFDNMKGGYFTEGKVLKDLRDGDATLAVDRQGKVIIGQYGRDLTNDGSWLSLRQNMILIVDAGVSQVQRGLDEGVWWGAGGGNELYVRRSAVCQMKDGRLAYMLVADVDAEQLAQSMISLGCVKGMQLDINGNWPAFYTFEHMPDGKVIPHFLDERMGYKIDRYLTGSAKEFFAFFDAPKVPAASVLDA